VGGRRQEKCGHQVVVWRKTFREWKISKNQERETKQTISISKVRSGERK
jgi:hypothetical protein